MKSLFISECDSVVNLLLSSEAFYVCFFNTLCGGQIVRAAWWPVSYCCNRRPPTACATLYGRAHLKSSRKLEEFHCLSQPVNAHHIFATLKYLLLISKTIKSKRRRCWITVSFSDHIKYCTELKVALFIANCIVKKTSPKTAKHRYGQNLVFYSRHNDIF